MNKYTWSTLSIVVLLGVGLGIFWKIGPTGTPIDPHVRILTGPETQDYVGLNGYGMSGDFPDGMIELDPATYDLSAYDLPPNKKLRVYDFPEQGVYALKHVHDAGMTITVRNSIIVIDKKTGQTEEYLFPESSDTANIAKVGDNIFVRYLHRTDYSRLIPTDNRFYIFDIAERKFRRLEMSPAVSDIIRYKFYVLPDPDDQNIFAIGYCNKQGWDDCVGFGIALSDSQYLKKVMDVGLPFTIGWKDSDLFIRKGDTVYLIDPSEVK